MQADFYLLNNLELHVTERLKKDQTLGLKFDFRILLTTRTHTSLSLQHKPRYVCLYLLGSPHD